MYHRVPRVPTTFYIPPSSVHGFGAPAVTAGPGITTDPYATLLAAGAAQAAAHKRNMILAGVGLAAGLGLIAYALL